MNAKEIKSKLSLEHIITILQDLGAEPKEGFSTNEILCKTICHCGDSHKLYLYKSTLNFHCYTNCGSLDILQIIQNVRGCSLTQAIDYISSKFGFYTNSFHSGFNTLNHNNDLDILDSLSTKREVYREEKWKDFKVIPDKALMGFYNFHHESFLSDGVSSPVLNKFEVKFDILNNRVILPHRNSDGSLIAIRCRNLDKELCDAGKKYLPIILDNQLLSAPTSQYFYGLYQNQDNIRKAKKVILVESEKAVMQYETMFPNSNIALALSSSNLSMFQIQTLKDLGVDEVIVALDKEFHICGTNEEYIYFKKLKKSILNRINFCTVSLIWDRQGLIDYKDSPLDKGKIVFTKLLKDRIYGDALEG